ncbi:MAG: hypothetical protein P4M13_05425, partial [Alphaproteobacteria bacterium]|nr:hypothetical protein [Alphaproteobacteria bacterium]
YVKAEVTICHYPDDTLAIFHGHQCLARFSSNGAPLSPAAAAVVYRGDKCSGASRLHTYPHDKQPPPPQPQQQVVIS